MTSVWISPVIKNTPGGYHGYWAENWDKINENFGSADDLKQLTAAIHNKNMKVMVGIVCNHVGPVGFDYSSLYPFNKEEHYHDYCDIRQEDFQNN